MGILGWVWCTLTGKKDREEMQAIKSSLDLAIQQMGRREDSHRLIETIEKMALALIPAAKDAVSPIGNTCETIKFGDGKKYFTTIDREDKAVINGEVFEVGPEQEYRVLISELDMRKRTCRVSLRDDLKMRYPAKITDPGAELANNKYALAMANKAIVTIKAKTKIVEGKIREFVVSDIV
jgi:hypothetical protein